MFDTNDDLPFHPRTGLQAIGIGKRGPIWPQMGGAPDPEDPPSDPAPDGAPQDNDPAQAGSESAPPAFTPITSQEQFDKALGRRLAQAKAQYADYDDVKAKAAEYDKLQDSQKSETERNLGRITALEKENAELKQANLRAEVAAAKGLTPKQAARLRGTTREELEADADDFLDDLPKPPAQVSQQPRESLRGGGKPDEEPEETDPHKLAARIPR